MKHTEHQTKVLRKLLRLACLERDKRCKRCGYTSFIETSHIYGKGAFPAMQYEIQNVIALCGNGSPLNCHHNWWHKDQTVAREWFEAKYPERADYLRELSQTFIKTEDYKAIRTRLEGWIKFYKNNPLG